MTPRPTVLRRLLGASAAALMVAGLAGPALSQTAPAQTAPAPATPSAPMAAPAGQAAPGGGQFQPVRLQGFLPREALVDSLALVPPPPAPGSAAQAADDEARRGVLTHRETVRWRRATRDADYRSPRVVDAFACAIGVAITPETTPQTYMLLRRSLIDAGLATYRAKVHYKRTRPFVAANDNVTCYPQDNEQLRTDGSYPSGHASFGWAWGLILAEMFPSQANLFIQRGFDYGQSRVVCGVHWQSDVNAGRVVGAAVVAQLRANPEFRAQFEAAQKELMAARAANQTTGDCALDQTAQQ